jgi:predicted RNA-binding Zn ribbon-like protein
LVASTLGAGAELAPSGVVLDDFVRRLTEAAEGVPTAAPAAHYKQLREVLESVAAETFGSGHVRPGHLSAGQIEVAAVRATELLPELQAHLAQCERCSSFVADYSDSRSRVPFDQFPDSD